MIGANPLNGADFDPLVGSTLRHPTQLYTGTISPTPPLQTAVSSHCG